MARAKLKTAEYTSDLSTTEEVCYRRKTKKTIPDPPLYSSHMETSSVQKGKQVFKILMWTIFEIPIHLLFQIMLIINLRLQVWKVYH